MFTSVIGDVSNGLNVMSGLWCTLTSLMLGIIIAYVYQKQGNYSKNFTVTLAILPMLVSFVIMMVNGNLGTGVAVVGAFSLVRFRSVPGSSREIVAIFFSMAIGLAVGMGFLTFAIFIGIIVSFVSLLLFRSKFADENQHDKELKIIIPENLDYTQIFDDIFLTYTIKAELIRVKTIQMGSMIEVIYHIQLRNLKLEKQMIDELRCRNGNLMIVCAKRQAISDGL
ncbi:MAG: DUF4956 domain-containing protein [Erysipelotrichia bacterium]|nr:DUF4956 domain-containing protein [Erysipelotrichia bacterium]